MRTIILKDGTKYRCKQPLTPISRLSKVKAGTFPMKRDPSSVNRVFVQSAASLMMKNETYHAPAPRADNVIPFAPRAA